MALLLQTHYPLSLRSPRCPYLFPNPYYHSFLIIPTNPLPRFNAAITFSGHRTPSRPSSAPPAASAFDRHARPATPLLKAFARAAVSALLFLCFGVRMCLASSPPAAAALPTVQDEQTVQGFQEAQHSLFSDMLLLVLLLIIIVEFGGFWCGF